MNRPPEDPERLSRRTRGLLVAAVLLLALGLRLFGALQDVRFSYHGDELHFVKRSMAMGTGDLNPHWFHKPAFLMYTLLFCYGTYYAAGSALGAFGSVGEFGASFLNEPGAFVLIGRLLVVAFGTATVFVVYRIGRRAFGGFVPALAAALAAAVLFPMVAGSQAVKADVPAGFFVALSFLFFLRSRDTDRWRPLVLASLLAGVAMGTKYYGILLLPAYGLAELCGRFTHGRPWTATLLRSAAVGLLFVAGFFASSPYNLLDPTWLRGQLENAAQSAGLEEGETVFRADNEVAYTPGPGTILGASVHFFGRAVHPRAFGVAVAALAAAGLVACLLDRRRRAFAACLALAFFAFWLLAVTMNAYHTNWRHFNAIAPLACTLVFPGAVALAGLLRARRAHTVALGIVAVALLPTLVEGAAFDAEKTAPDTRTRAYEWIVENVPRDERLLLDEYGPILQLSPESARRLAGRLEGLPEDEAFTRHQKTRLELIERFPGAEAMNLDELAHPWWLPREPTPGELRASFENRDMGNPLKERVPRALEAYVADGYRWVVTNSWAQARYYESEESKRAFPSFVRFYDALHALEPVKTFDPERIGGKGPVVWVYQLERRP